MSKKATKHKLGELMLQLTTVTNEIANLLQLTTSISDTQMIPANSVFVCVPTYTNELAANCIEVQFSVIKITDVIQWSNDRHSVEAEHFYAAVNTSTEEVLFIQTLAA